jgi:hypothetical protein
VNQYHNSRRKHIEASNITIARPKSKKRKKEKAESTGPEHIYAYRENKKKSDMVKCL